MKGIYRLVNGVYSIYALLWFFILMVPVLVLYILISWMPDKIRLRNIYRINWVWLHLWSIGTGVWTKLEGRKNLDSSQAYVIICNHSNMLDIPVAGGRLQHAFKPLAKKEFLKVPIFGWIMGMISVLVDRKSTKSRVESLEVMVATLKEDISLLIFPEGTRNKTDSPLTPFHDGAFRVAIQAQKPVLPIVMLNIRNLQPVGTFRVYPGLVVLRILPSIPTKGMINDDLAKLKKQVFDAMYTEIDAFNKRNS